MLSTSTKASGAKIEIIASADGWRAIPIGVSTIG
jgi:hypothetical protein